MKSRTGLILALILPIIILAANAWLHHQQRSSGETVIFPIEGFDPRDLLSGHYLTYRIDYGVAENSDCPVSDIPASLCLSPERRIYPLDELPETCTQFIRGSCDAKAQFISGLERFYIPEQYADVLDAKVRNNQGELVVSVGQSGNAGITDLLIDGRPWKEAVEAAE
ncbi:MAG: GDYXXLXY domain-containing protein [Thiolinea sp.]